MIHRGCIDEVCNPRQRIRMHGQALLRLVKLMQTQIWPFFLGTTMTFDTQFGSSTCQTKPTDKKRFTSSFTLSFLFGATLRGRCLNGFADGSMTSKLWDHAKTLWFFLSSFISSSLSLSSRSDEMLVVSCGCHAICTLFSLSRVGGHFSWKFLVEGRLMRVLLGKGSLLTLKIHYRPPRMPLLYGPRIEGRSPQPCRRDWGKVPLCNCYLRYAARIVFPLISLKFWSSKARSLHSRATI